MTEFIYYYILHINKREN